MASGQRAGTKISVNSRPKISIPPRSGHYGLDVNSAVVALFRDRTGQPYTESFNHSLAANGDLFRPSYDNIDAARGLGLLLNRVETRTGLSFVPSTEQAAAKVGLLASRFIPALASETTALQWDVLNRAARMLEEDGMPDRLMNRHLGDPSFSDTDWSAAKDVFTLLEDQVTEVVDRGKILERAGDAQVRGVFRGAITRLMDDEGLTHRQAFDRLQDVEPIFWCHAMLSFELPK